MNNISTPKKINKVSRSNADTFIFPVFSLFVHKVLFNTYPNSFFVGGAVRNMLLQTKITDIDIATSAKPDEVVAALHDAGITFEDTHKKMGVIIARKGTQKIEITTFRKEQYKNNRFPSITFTKSSRIDSNRRDFTVNALYYNPVTKEILDYHNGLIDLQNKHLKFIGNSNKRIIEDPLRIIRAYKFSLQYNLEIDSSTEQILRTQKKLLQKINAQRIEKEILKIKNKNLQNKLRKVIHSNA